MGYTKKDLEEKIKQLYGIQELTSLMNAQINKYVLERRWSYLEIARALAYCFAERGMAPKPEAGIGIVPYVMEDARKYFKQLEEQTKRQKEQSEQFQKQKKSNYDIECKELPKVERVHRELIDLGAIVFEEEDNE